MVGIKGQRDAVFRRAIGGPNSAAGRAQRWRRHADELRSYITHIESLPIGRAVQFIDTRRAQALGVEQAAAARSQRLEPLPERAIHRQDPKLGRGM
jgi:hypothetical protein